MAPFQMNQLSVTSEPKGELQVLRCRSFSSLYLDRRLVRSGPLRWVALHWLIAPGVVALVAVTWRLWTPQNLFPQVPLIGIGQWIPTWLDWPLLTVFIAAPTLAAACSTAGATGGLPARAGAKNDSLRRNALIAFVAAGILLVLANQHRFQPWAYQFVLLALVLALTTPNRALGLARALTVGIYVYSAWSKLDYRFLHELGPRMTAPLLDLVGISPDTAPIGFAAVLPVGELLVACGLLFRRTRRIALAASIAMHVMLLFVFSRWGLDHSWGVLLWNVFFIAQNLVLFTPTRCRPQHARSSQSLRPSQPQRNSGLATAIVTLSLVLPLVEPWGWFDVWPSWGLYASRAERATVLLRTARDESIPAPIRPYLREVSDSPGWQHLDLHTWSLATLDAPLYPQNRFQLGVVRSITDRLPPDVEIRVQLHSQSNRWTGDRSSKELLRRPKIQAEAAKYLLRPAPRRKVDLWKTIPGGGASE